MLTDMALSVCLCVLLLIPNACVAYTTTDAAALRNHIFTNYSTKDRPENTTKVTVSFGLFHITMFDIISQRLQGVGFLVSSWTDTRLQWTASNYGNMEVFFGLLSDVWSPPLLISNSAEEIMMLNDIGELSSSNVYMTYDGNVTWLTPVSIDAQCSVNIMYYPFDTQDCIIVVSSWLYLEQQIDLEIANIFFDLYEENGEWDIASSSSEDKIRVLAGYQLSAVHFNLSLKRKYSYYVVNMILPIIILALLGPLTFMLPIQSGEKIGFTLTILLSLSVVMSTVSDSIPPTSTHVCLLSVYVLLTFCICSAETVLTVIACTFHEYHNKGLQMSKPLQKLARGLAKVTLYRKHGDKDDGHESKLSDVADEEMSNPKQLPNNEHKPKAWEDNPDTEINIEINFTYGEMVDLMDRLNLYTFSFLTVLITLVFMITIAAGGSA